ncbi:hypothetical protein ACFV23_56645, partial [Streptomyces sp. NPDC059627]
MRGSIDGLGSSVPIGRMLPAVFADDDLALRFVAGLDDVIAPIPNVLDCLPSYFDPALAPLDFAEWRGRRGGGGGPPRGPAGPRPRPPPPRGPPPRGPRGCIGYAATAAWA